MRTLTVKQKRIIDEWFNRNKGIGFLTPDNLDYELLTRLAEVNDTEILNQETARYLNDKIAEEML